MNVSAQKTSWNREVLLSANQQLELLYQQKQDPCLALMISRNYQLHHKQIQAVDERKKWLDKAQMWQQQYSSVGTKKMLGLFFDANNLSYDSI